MNLRHQFVNNLRLLRRAPSENARWDIVRNLTAILNAAVRAKFSGRYPAYPLTTFMRRATYVVMKLHGMDPAPAR